MGKKSEKKLKKQIKDLKNEISETKEIEKYAKVFEGLGNKEIEQMLPGMLTNQFDNAVEGNMVPSVELNGQRWDLFSRALSDRTLILTGQVNDQMADVFVKALMHLEHQDPEAPIRVIINSPGGSVTAGLAMYDAMREVTCPVHTKVMGLAASMGSLLLCGGDERSASRNSLIMIHQPMGGAQQGTQHTDMEITAGFMTYMREMLTQIYVDHSGLTHEEVDKSIQRDNWLGVDRALELGLIDKIIEPEGKKLPKYYGTKRSGKAMNAFEKMDDQNAEVAKARAERLAKEEAANQNAPKKNTLKLGKNK